MRGSAAFRAAIAPGGVLAGPWVKNSLWRTARAVPSLDQPFADTKSLVDAVTGQSLVTFTRASSGTYVGSDGVLQTATTNLLLRSEEFDNASWTKASASSIANAAAAPNGFATADKLIEDSSLNIHYAFQLISVTAGNSYTLSVYAKAAERSEIYIALSAFNSAFLSNADCYFNLANGTIRAAGANATARISNAGSGWYRCSITGVAQTTTSAIINAGSLSNGSTHYYTGDGTSGIYLWGAQLEQSSTVGEYIPTTSTINSAPRFDHNPTTGESLGLLVEEQRTNNVLQSEDFATTWILNNISVSSNTVVAPDGTTTADTISPPTDGLTTPRFLRQNPALTTQQAYTFSVFVKIGTATTNGIALYVSDSTATNNFRGGFNIFSLTTSATGTGWATPTAAIIPYPNGWYRCVLSGVTSTAHTSLRAIIYLSLFGNVADTYGSMHIWGAQLEAGAFPTSYIPTGTATVTRSADVASITGANFSSWYNQNSGTFVSHYAAGANGARPFFVSNVDTQERLDQRVLTSYRQGTVWLGGVGYSDYADTSQTFVANVAWKHATAQDGSVLVIGSNNGTSQVAITRSPAVDRMWIGSFIGTGTFLNGTIRRLVYWGQRLPNNVLQAITQ